MSTTTTKHAIGQIKRLPLSREQGSALLLCRACYEHEIRYRRERNRELAAAATGTAFELPTWDSLKVYNRNATQDDCDGATCKP